VLSVAGLSAPTYGPARTLLRHANLNNSAIYVGVKPIRLHDARHSCGTAMHLRGVPLAVIAKWLGHADASITARLYTHSQDEALAAAAASLGAVVTSGGVLRDL
jgi:integrase